MKAKLMNHVKRSTFLGGLCAALVGLATVGLSSTASAQQLSGFTYDNVQRVPVVTPLYVPSASRYTASVYCEAGETIEFFGNRYDAPDAVVPCVATAGGNVGQATATLTAPNISPASAVVAVLTTRVKNAAGVYTYFNGTKFLIYTDLLNNSYNGSGGRGPIVTPNPNTIGPGVKFTVDMPCYSTETVEYSFAGTTGKAVCPPTGNAVSVSFVGPSGTYPMTGTFTLPGVATYTFVVGSATSSSTTIATSTTVSVGATTTSPPYTVTPSSIPVTGASSQTVPLTGAAIALALTGAALAFIGRRRQTDSV